MLLKCYVGYMLMELERLDATWITSQSSLDAVDTLGRDCKIFLTVCGGEKEHAIFRFTPQHKGTEKKKICKSRQSVTKETSLPTGHAARRNLVIL